MARTREFNTAKVLNKAMFLFWERGYNGVSTQELIDDFGISKSSMYGAFGDKKELFLTVLHLYSTRIIEDLEARFAKAITVKMCFEQLFTELNNNSLNDSKGCFIVNSAIELAPHDSKVANLVQNHRIYIETIFSKAIQEGINSGEFSSSNDPQQLSKLFSNTVNGIYVGSKFIKEPSYFSTVSSSLLSSLK